MNFLTIAFLAEEAVKTDAHVSAKYSIISEAIKVIPALAWVILVGCALFMFRAQAKFLLDEIAWRIKAGAAFKLASIEIGSPYVAHKQ